MRNITACKHYMTPKKKAELSWLEIAANLPWEALVFDDLKEDFIRIVSDRILEAEGQGIESVTSIRCMKHRVVPTLNNSEGTGECPICDNEHEEHLQRRVADGWYALHYCRECREEWNHKEEPDRDTI